jgi:serine phosphatase RsbU (regulator of sigma subunit)
LYLYTDGLIEARQGDGDELGIEGFKTLIRRCRQREGGPRARWLAGTLGRAQVRDDLTLLLVDGREAAHGG